MSYAIGSGNLDRIKNEMEIFDTLSIKDTNRELAAVRIQRDAAKALSKGDTATAMEKLKEAKRKCDPYSTYGRFGILCDNQIACLLTEQKKYQEAISLVKTICLDGDTPLEMKSQSSHMLANLYAEVCQADSSLKYNIMHQTLADSIFKSQQFGRIRDIRELRQLQKLDSKLILAESERKRSDMALRIAIGIGLLVLAFTTMLLLQNRKLRQRNLDLFRRNKEVREAENRERAIREEYERRLAEISSGVGNELNNTSESEKKRQADKKRKGPRLTRSLHDEILSRIIQILDNDTEISSTDFSLSRLSEMVNSNTHYVSEVINEAYGKNFNTLLGELRVNKACRLLDDNINYRHLTLEAIAMESGFKSRGNFAVVFKKVTGLTPSSYRKIAMEQAESSESSD